MEEVQQWVEQLTAPQPKIGYAALLALVEWSGRSDQVFPYLDQFFAMLDSPNSYVRTRGLILIAKNARWDTAGRVERGLDTYLAHITDEKPITARQCIQSLADLLAAKPNLARNIRAALESADFSRYPDSMSPLLQKDAIKRLKQIDAILETGLE